MLGNSVRTFNIGSITLSTTPSQTKFVKNKHWKMRQRKIDLLQIAKDFIKTFEHRDSSNDLMKFYHANIVQIEYPNTLTKKRGEKNIAGFKGGIK